MQRELVIKGRSLGGSSDLTLLAPIRPGFVESLESLTYKTRAKRVLQALHGLRMAAHEQAPARLVSDAIERVAVIQAVRVAVIEPEGRVLLAVSFDGPWESYIRVLWQKVGTLLDLVFCNTQDYVSAREHSFEQWRAWAQRVQIETGFHYGPPDSTARDLLYHRRVERMNPRLPAADRPLAELRSVLPSAEDAVQRLVDPPRPLASDDPPHPPMDPGRMVRERVRQGLQGLAALYRLTDLYRPGTADGDVLRHAALGLLDEFVRIRDQRLIDEELAEERDGPQDGPVEQRPKGAGRFVRQLDWLFPDARPALVPRPSPALPDRYAAPAALRADVQAGILRPYPRVNAGLIVLLALPSRAAAVALLADLEDPKLGITSDADVDDASAAQGVVYRHLSFTAAGLRALGLDEDELALFSQEFRQGMAQRAGLLGDVHSNHPRRWRLPRRPGAQADDGSAAVAMDAVHAVLQLRCLVDLSGLGAEAVPPALQAELDRLHAMDAPPTVLAHQSLRRHYQDFPKDKRGELIVEHFGYADGDGQPDIEWQGVAAEFKRNRVALGEILLGHANAVDPAPAACCPHASQAARQSRQSPALAWQANGSYLVLRKYRQDVAMFDAAVHKTAERMLPLVADKPARETRADKLARCIRLVRAKLMGRRPDGLPLVQVADKTRPNVFTYDLDPQGQQCPLHAHVRRAHPRDRAEALVRPPRLMRRSMSYGPRYDAAQPDTAERGLVFMAYNASLGEQFEVVQRWLAGGNSTGASSGTACPIVGVPTPGLARHFRFEVEGHEFVVELDPLPVPPPPPLPRANLFDDLPVTTRLDWGLYLFSPSRTALRRLRERAATGLHSVPWQIERGRALLQELAQVAAQQGSAAAAAAWKTAIEDPEAIDRLDGAALWAAIRQDHGGLLRTPYGVLVAERRLVADVYLDPKGRYSVCGQLDRMRRSFGEIALGMDESPRYRKLASAINTAIGQRSLADTFDRSFKAVQRRIGLIQERANEQSLKVGDPRVEVGLDARELLDEVLATLCEDWFGVQDSAGGDALLRRGPADWAWQPGQPPLYPGHFTALSRYMFQPNPGPMAIELGQAYGQALRSAMRTLVQRHRARKTTPQTPAGGPAPLALAVFTDPEHLADGDGGDGGDGADDLIARTMVGVLMGFNPTIVGAVLNVLSEWHRDGLFGTLRARLAGASDLKTAYAVLYDAMAVAAQMRPMPQIGWRTATVDHRLGDELQHAVDVRSGDRIVMAMVSGTQQSLADGGDDGRLMFGGVRGQLIGSYPTHACPGYDAGIGAMLGALAGLLSWSQCTDLRPGAGAHSFVLEAATAPKRTPEVQPRPPGGGDPLDDPHHDRPLDRCHPRAPAPAAPGRQQAQGLIMAWGDSWLDYALAGDLRDRLEDLGYRLPHDFCKYSVWPKASTMAARTGPFCDALDAQLISGEPPLAIVLSAGGNDSTGDALRRILREEPDESKLPFDSGALDRHIEGIEQSYITILDTILAVQDHHRLRVPVLVHGYDHPIPQGTSAFGTYADKWMYKPFAEVGVHCKGPGQGRQRRRGRETMAELIARLNAMLAKLALTKYPGRVHHVDLQCTLAFKDWTDDLHPTRDGFTLLADRLHRMVQMLIDLA